MVIGPGHSEFLDGHWTFAFSNGSPGPLTCPPKAASRSEDEGGPGSPKSSEAQDEGS